MILAVIRTQRLAGGTLSATGTIYTCPAGFHTLVKRLSLFVTVTGFTVVVASLVPIGATFSSAFYRVENPALNSVHNIDVQHVLDDGHGIRIATAGPGGLAFWLSGTEYTD